ncbi:hypothetical protein GFC30_1119 [Anoxybacillus amylolyticus]|uniref:Uncharacterized protein n=1 Tax=Anoxybacteroides amylolyticum TaxID=294699 RepID=A0A160F5S7_9BACL|nr:hypothetical protein GFC30_1119 [Anoxybacillus amylolyticus]
MSPGFYLLINTPVIIVKATALARCDTYHTRLENEKNVTGMSQIL